jgi:hypothetical protein
MTTEQKIIRAKIGLLELANRAKSPAAKSRSSSPVNTISPAELHSPTLQEKVNVAAGTCTALATEQFQQPGQSPAR